jgi:integrase/recombinase XerD
MDGPECQGIRALPMAAPIPSQADSDSRLIELWLHGRNASTATAYSADITAFLAFIAKPVRAATIGDIQAWLDQLPGAPASRARRLASIKSLLSFAARINYVPFNVGAAVRAPAVTRVLAERILTEEEVIRLIAMERGKRNHALLRLLYLAALRVSELCRLRWKDCRARKPGGQISVVGKRSKVRAILLPASMWQELAALKGGAGPDDPVFRSRQGGPLDVKSVQRIVKAAAIRAGLSPDVTPHWLRHAHCSHALDRGANPALVRDTAGHSDLKVTSVYSHARPDQSSSLFLVG